MALIIVTGLSHVVIGVTDVPPEDELLVNLTAADPRYHLCGILANKQDSNTRLRVPCKSARGRYVFIKKTVAEDMKLYEVEVYVQRKYDIAESLNSKLSLGWL